MKSSTTIIARVAGGLGNQMFQYATAFALARRLGRGVGIDTCCCDPSPASPRAYQLHQLSVSGTLLTPDRVTRLLYKSLSSADHPGYRLASPLLHGVLRVRDIKETTEFVFDAGLASRIGPSRHRLLGYWQSPHYFGDADTQLRCEFRFRTAPDAANQRVLDQIRACTAAVSVHVRRGDYLNVRPEAVLPVAYYLNAAQLVLQAVPSATFFVFSDDPAWVAQNFRLGSPTVFVDANTAVRAHYDLQLMSSCAHHIIANSSFSWWGAWLNPSPEKLVIAPHYWLGTSDSHFPDLYPAGWRTILPETV